MNLKYIQVLVSKSKVMGKVKSYKTFIYYRDPHIIYKRHGKEFFLFFPKPDITVQPFESLDIMQTQLKFQIFTNFTCNKIYIKIINKIYMISFSFNY